MYFFLHFKNTTALQGAEQIGEKGRGDRRPLGGCVGTQCEMVVVCTNTGAGRMKGRISNVQEVQWPDPGD